MPITVGNSTTNTTITNSTVTVPNPQSWQVTNAGRNLSRPTLLLPFAESLNVDPRITFIRASSATYFNQAGVMTTASTNVPRIDFNPVTGVCNGFLIEESRTNYVRNGYGSGGSSSALPTYWSTNVSNGVPRNGLTVTFGGTVVNQGVQCYRFTISGTATANGTFIIYYENGGSTLAGMASGTTFQQSIYMALVSGSTFGSVVHWGPIKDSIGSTVQDNQLNFAASLTTTMTRMVESQTTPTSANSNLTATITSATWSGGVVTCTGTGFTFDNVGNGRIVQISGSGTIDGNRTVTSLTGSTQFTFALASDPGAITVPCTVTWNIPSFSCPYAAVLFYYNTGNTANITFDMGCGQQEIGAFPTSFITTTGVSATRSADLATIPLGSWYNTTASTVLVEAQKNTSADSGYGGVVELNDGSVNNRFQFYVSINTTTLRFGDNYTSNLLDAQVPAGSYSLATPYKAAGAISGAIATSGTIAASLNGATAVTGTTGNFPGARLTQMQIGGISGGTAYNMNGWIQRIAYYPVAFSNTQLQAMSS